MTYLYAWDIDKTLNIINEGDIEVITYANKSNYYFPYLLKSSNINNYPLKIIGWNTEWKGYCSKIQKVYEYLITLDSSYNNKYMLLIDGWDILLVRSYFDLINDMKNVNYDIIISSANIDKTEMPNYYIRYFLNSIIAKIFNSKTIKNSSNAGAYIIKISKFKEIYNYFKPLENMDDQTMINNFININNKNTCLVDIERHFFLTCNSLNVTSLLILLKKKIINPFVIHVHSNFPMDIFLKFYFKNISIEELNRIRPKTYYLLLSRAPYTIKMFLSNSKMEIIFMSFIGFLIYIYHAPS
jgi:hypothetical protein